MRMKKQTKQNLDKTYSQIFVTEKPSLLLRWEGSSNRNLGKVAKFHQRILAWSPNNNFHERRWIGFQQQPQVPIIWALPRNAILFLLPSGSVRNLAEKGDIWGGLFNQFLLNVLSDTFWTGKKLPYCTTNFYFLIGLLLLAFLTKTSALWRSRSNRNKTHYHSFSRVVVWIFSSPDTHSLLHETSRGKCLLVMYLCIQKNHWFSWGCLFFFNNNYVSDIHSFSLCLLEVQMQK